MKTADVQQLHRLNPKNDFLFKRLFGEKEGKRLLIGLLNAILRREGAQMITDVSIIEDTKLARELVEDKEAVLDILCEVDGREKVNVEMQVRRFVRMDYRSLFYVGKLLTESLHHGDPYDRLQRSIGVNILDHHYLPLEKFHSTFHLYEDEERSYMLTDILELHFIECPKFRRLPFDIRDPLHRWLRFLDQQTTTEQLEELMKVDELFKEAEARLSYLASDEETRRRYALREKALHDRASLLNDARTAGIKEGIKEGINNTAINMLKEGLDAALICRITGLDAAQIERLKENRMCKPETNGQE
ncbi:Rpn family recombination-promoting nuclease/putative transposase [Paenibacillus dendritiformis]|uniref:Rpn family recombination-promoting nuclease/putative transposase n=1 Tax=Paenibacillus dendritiformis TaxID=130049 RepID=UPI00248B9BA5|nr:Rpn family recombination-promoting nuclease/putative transposase [Paenibacillus dendritiformis]WGU92433.1 Rpn family recombination-promoting nuclease/putative transposase [Paenibacillus dendritiformis]